MESQAENKESDDQGEIEMPREKGIILLNESKCVVISIC